MSLGREGLLDVKHGERCRDAPRRAKTSATQAKYLSQMGSAMTGCSKIFIDVTLSSGTITIRRSQKTYSCCLSGSPVLACLLRSTVVSQAPQVNRLAGSSSPYLLDHAADPVAWQPWDALAWQTACDLDRPVLLSIGYSACHWCHVMARESFRDPAIAALINQNFVAIKVDREERPDLDELYISAALALNGSAGWPLTVFLTPAQRPFFGGTYSPPEDRQRLPGFGKVLSAISEAWKEQRPLLEGEAEQLTRHLQQLWSGGSPPDRSGSAAASPDPNALDELADPEYGGFGRGSKFPHAAALELWLAQSGPSSRRSATLAAMVSGGLFDPVGAGFHRYTVDRAWRLPHFEKMLYDNALLAAVYLHAAQREGRKDLLQVALDTLETMLRDFSVPGGGLGCSLDADGLQGEGGFYLWEESQLRAAGLDPEQRALLEPVSGRFLPMGRLRYDPEYREGLLALQALRAQRVGPRLDNKQLASWNGLALSALSEAAWVTGDSKWLMQAKRSASWARSALWDGQKLRHSPAQELALLEDQALYGLGLLDLFKASGEVAWLHWARELWRGLERNFTSGTHLRQTEQGPEQAPLQAVSFLDGSYVGAGSAACRFAQKIGGYFPELSTPLELAREWLDRAGLRPDSPADQGYAWLTKWALEQPSELVLLGSPEQREPFRQIAAGFYLPLTTVVCAGMEAGAELGELALGREPGLAYVCRSGVCHSPARTPEELSEQLRSLAPS